jgi:uncharacterized membrane protein SirB2
MNEITTTITSLLLLFSFLLLLLLLSFKVFDFVSVWLKEKISVKELKICCFFFFFSSGSSPVERVAGRLYPGVFL